MQATTRGPGKALAWLCALFLAAVGAAQAADIDIRVDASDEAQRVLRIHERMAATPGTLRLSLPRGRPGPEGARRGAAPIAGLVVQAGGQPLRWQPDPADPLAYRVEVPAGASEIVLDYQSGPASAAPVQLPAWSRNFLNLQWTALLLCPQDRPVEAILAKASLRLPASWRHASALRRMRMRDDWIEFQPERLDTLVDSPVFAGLHHRRIALDPPGTSWPVVMHVFADDPARLQPGEAQIEAHRALIRQGAATFGQRPWRHYDLLLAIGDELPEMALEHRESSQNFYKPDGFSDWAAAPPRRGELAQVVAKAWMGQ